MKPEIKKLWIDALRSGKYKQGKNLLKTKEDKFCCLGVLCDLYIKKMKCKGWEININTKDYELDSESGTLPDKVMNWAGLDTDEGRYKSENSLADDNDSGKSFKQIANIIEKNF